MKLKVLISSILIALPAIASASSCEVLWEAMAYAQNRLYIARLNYNYSFETCYGTDLEKRSCIERYARELILAESDFNQAEKIYQESCNQN